MDGLMQERCNSIANVLELHLSGTNLSISAQIVRLMELTWEPLDWRLLYDAEVVSSDSSIGMLRYYKESRAIVYIFTKFLLYIKQFKFFTFALHIYACGSLF